MSCGQHGTHCHRVSRTKGFSHAMTLYSTTVMVTVDVTTVLVDEVAVIV